MFRNVNENDSDEDYMSDVFLDKSQSVKPGLVTGRLAKVYKKENTKVHPKSFKTLQEESRQEGFKKEISSDNIGFKLLSKMGFKKDTGIGKIGTGIKEPISVVLKTDRSGLGHSTSLKRGQERKSQELQAKKQKREQDWRAIQKLKATEASGLKHLKASQNACMQLDMKKGVVKPLVSFYWPKTDEDDEDNDDDSDHEVDEENLENEEKLVRLTSYLRDTYHFCVWCGIEFKDENDMDSTCPGDDAAQHEE